MPIGTKNQNLSIGRTTDQQHISVQVAQQFDTQSASVLCTADSMHQVIVYCSEDNAFFTYYHTLFQIKGQVQQAIVHLQVNTSYLDQMMQNHAKDDNTTLSNGASTIQLDGADYLMVISARSSKSGIKLINLIPLSCIGAELKAATSHMLVNGFCIWLVTVFAIYLFT